MADGSRHFASFRESATPAQVLRHVVRLRWAVPYFYLPTPSETWIDFWYRGHRFSINDQHGEYWFFVHDPACPDAVLETIAAHFGALLRAPASGGSSPDENEE